HHVRRRCSGKNQCGSGVGADLQRFYLSRPTTGGGGSARLAALIQPNLIDHVTPVEAVRYQRRFFMKTLLKLLVVMSIPVSAWALSLNDFSNQDAALGLKEALTQGVTKAVASLGTTDGFLGNPKVKISLPKKLAKAESVLRMAGMGDQADELITAMNRAAEAAVPEAKPLLVNAVKSMTMDDAKAILSGGNDSVTKFFKDKTSAQLTEKFLPIVKKHTANVGLAQKYDELAGKGAQMGLIKPEDAQVDNYVARAAMDGLFKMIGEEEKAIRANPMQAAGSMAKKIFGAMGQ